MACQNPAVQYDARVMQSNGTNQETVMKWLDDTPYLILIGLAALMAMLPFEPQPHLVEKLNMLSDGTLSKPMDIFDLLWHLLPAILLLLKFLRSFRNQGVD
jgi:hypothetical protein